MAENTGLTSVEVHERLSVMKQLEDLEHIKRLDLMQKSKIKWAIEGDENTKYFHGIVNSKLSCSRINGLYIDGQWISDPSFVTPEIFTFHKTKFQDNSPPRPLFTSNLFKTLSSHESSLLDALFSFKEIKEAVWNCGGSKAPGPDGFMISERISKSKRAKTDKKRKRQVQERDLKPISKAGSRP
ncbi:hypothetical protein Tco_0303772, partial [Tanacetum coccineum]